MKISQDIMTLLAEYNAYEEETLDGKFGKTAQFYMIYKNLINYYLILNRSIRVISNYTNIYSLGLPTRFLNQPNFAR